VIANFTPVSAAIGGVLIGLAATLLMLFNGRVAGISGILAACLNLRGSEKSWSAAFIAGLILAPLTASLAGFPMPAPRMPDSWTLVVVAGVLAAYRSAIVHSDEIISASTSLTCAPSSCTSWSRRPSTPAT